MLKKGKIYRVRNYAVSPDAQHQQANEAIVEEHGWLWFEEAELEAADAGEG